MIIGSARGVDSMSDADLVHTPHVFEAIFQALLNASVGSCHGILFLNER